MAGPGRSRCGWLTSRPIAHRGLHDGNRAVVENSGPAFEAAIAAGYAIECDVQLSADGTPHIFHDWHLQRLTGLDAEFRLTGDAELRTLRLGSTDAVIPTVKEFLAFVAGRVPVVMEMKGIDPAGDANYVPALLAAISGYDGRLALMSFDDWLIDGTLAAGHDWPVGLTAEGTNPDVLAGHEAVFNRGCTFVSYNVHHLPNAFTEDIRARGRGPVISWTVRTPADVECSRSSADQMTFEGFRPQL